MNIYTKKKAAHIKTTYFSIQQSLLGNTILRFLLCANFWAENQPYWTCSFIALFFLDCALHNFSVSFCLYFIRLSYHRFLNIVSCISFLYQIDCWKKEKQRLQWKCLSSTANDTPFWINLHQVRSGPNIWKQGTTCTRTESFLTLLQ